MLLYIDESGNTGTKNSQGVSRYFTIGLVLFEDGEDAALCDTAITRLRSELGVSSHFEFHFSDNSDRIRSHFIRTIAKYNFYYLAVSFDKFSATNKSGNLSGGTMYRYVCAAALTEIGPLLERATVIFDRGGSRAFYTNLRRHLQEALADRDGHIIKKYKAQDSAGNNLLQLADYCTGVVSRKLVNKSGWELYYSQLKYKELAMIVL